MKVLFCTVGGSHQPIIKAIQDNQPDYIVFVCSEDDLDTGRSGSYEQIEKSGIFLKKHWEDEKATLPNIPSQLNLESNRYEVLRVYPDDIDNAYGKITIAIAQHVGQGNDVVVDYTGGTKTMSVSLSLAALDFDEVGLQLVTGSRVDLRKVKDGTEQTQLAQVGRTRFQMKLKSALRAWENFAYDDTVLHLDNQRPYHREDQALLQSTKNLSLAFSAWDRFDHAVALAFIDNYMGKYAKQLSPYIVSLRVLCQKGEKQTPAQLYDLWLNAERRAGQKRYDDATARTYRLLEWAVQWLLESQYDIKTDAVKAEKIPESMRSRLTAQESHKVGLRDAWEIAAYHGEDAVSEFWELNQERLMHLLSIRNYSILAHGYNPITEQDWCALRDFINDKLMPLLDLYSQPLGLKNRPQQLPTQFSL